MENVKAHFLFQFVALSSQEFSMNKKTLDSYHGFYLRCCYILIATGVKESVRRNFTVKHEEAYSVDGIYTCLPAFER